MQPEIEIKDLKKSFLSKRINSFVEIDKVIGQEVWGKENFSVELPNKWDFSLMALWNDKLIGYLIASRKELSVHIHRLAMDQEFQSVGVGSLMVNRLVEKARLFRLPISLKVHCDNHRAINFYKKIGFRVTRASDTNLEMQLFAN